ncbi:MAG TPA: helix-turn-helix domain-containing protein [Kofleriaceae bacterium]|nr:helix-turn-helix domain-containing protein [Kofleriaceae bacterium]
MEPGRALTQSFLAAAAASVGEALGGEEAMTAVTAAVVAQWEAGLAAWPEIDVAPERFGGELARRIGSPTSADAAVAAVAAIRGADVYLAIACCDGGEGAIARIDDVLARELKHVALKLHATPDQTTEIHAELRRILLVDEPPRRAALREYAGRGDLRGYIRVMATRALIRAINRGRREIAIADHEFFDRMLPNDDAEISFLRAQYHDAVDGALRAALAGLDARSRALLRYQLIDGWSIDQVGKLYGVHRATAARWLAEAREVLGTAIRTELAARLQISPAEVDSIVRLVQSRVDMSLDRLLVPEGSG